MTRTDVMASSRPQAVGVARMRRGSSGAVGRLVVLPVLLLAIALAAPSAAVAATSTTTSGYNAEPNKPTTGTSPAKEESKPTTGTSPSKEESKPTTTTKATAPATTGSAPTTQAVKASTLPFTGLDLRWIVGIGLLMMGAGFSIVVAQRRQGRDGGR
jgi:cytoskeletal protein RodZ